MSYFLKSGNTYRVANKAEIDIRETLPAGNYTVCFDGMSGTFYLEGIASFTMPSKLYGSCIRHTDRIINTFLSRPNSTGVMLNGEKGSGKTLLSKNVCIELAKQDVPSIIINSAFKGDAFNTFLQNIEQPCAIVFDEFEKVYDRNDQEEILTLLDGVFPSKKLFLFTCNDKYRVDFHMRNRPGRIYYMIDFKGLDGKFITEYCEDVLNEKKHIPTIVSIASIFAEFNFDMLKSLVEEMNRYNETPQEALELLNAKPEFDNGTEYDLVITQDGKEIEHTDSKKFNGNPLKPGGIEVGFAVPPEEPDSDSEWKYQVFTADSLVKLDTESGVFVFKDKNTQLTLTKVVNKPHSYFNMF